VAVTPSAATVMVTEECLCRAAAGSDEQWMSQSLKSLSLHTTVQGPFVVVKDRLAKSGKTGFGVVEGASVSVLQSLNSSAPSLQAIVRVEPPAANVMVTDECLCRAAWTVGSGEERLGRAAGAVHHSNIVPGQCPVVDAPMGTKSHSLA